VNAITPLSSCVAQIPTICTQQSEQVSKDEITRVVMHGHTHPVQLYQSHSPAIVTVHHPAEILTFLSASALVQGLLRIALVHNLQVRPVLKIVKLQLEMRATKSHSQELGKRDLLIHQQSNLRSPISEGSLSKQHSRKCSNLGNTRGIDRKSTGVVVLRRIVEE